MKNEQNTLVWKIATIVFSILFMYEAWLYIDMKGNYSELAISSSNCLQLAEDELNTIKDYRNSLCKWADYAAYLEAPDQTKETHEMLVWCEQVWQYELSPPNR